MASRHSKADAYADLLEPRALSGYRAVPGNISAQVLRRDEAEVTHFMTSPTGSPRTASAYSQATTC